MKARIPNKQEAMFIMKTCGTTLLLLAAALGCAVAPQEGRTQQTDVYLTFDPLTQLPTLVNETAFNAPIQFMSINYFNPTNPTPFTLLFGLDFQNKYTAAASSPATPTAWGVEFQSQAQANCPIAGGGTQQCHMVKIKMDSSQPPPPDGYKYSVLMNGKLLDPKVRPR